MEITLTSGKELKSINEAEMKHTKAEIKKVDQNSTIKEKRLNINGLSDETEQMKGKIEVAKDEAI